MLLSRATLFCSVASALACVAAVASCGGNVVFVSDGDDGAGGSGAGPSTTNVSVGPNTTNASVSVVTTISSNSTGVGSFCDTGEPAGIDSFECSDCVQCAQGEPCSGVIEACFSEIECSEFVDCIEFCDTDGCQEQCQLDHPDGVDGYLAILQCLVCDACPNNCDAQSNCPFF